MSQLFYHTMQDNAGNLLFDVSGTMRIAGTSTLATIYGDEALTVILPNPMTNHTSFGSFKCFLPLGDFDFYMAKSGYTFETLTGIQGYGTMAQQNADYLPGSLRIDGQVGIGRPVDPAYSLATVGAVFVAGSLTGQGNFNLTGSAAVGANLTVTGTTTLSGAATMSGAATVGSNLNVTGSAGLGGNLTVAGTTQLNGNVGIGMTPTYNLDISVPTNGMRVTGAIGFGMVPNASYQLVTNTSPCWFGGPVGIRIAPGSIDCYINAATNGMRIDGAVGHGQAPDPSYQIRLSLDAAGKPNGGSWLNTTSFRDLKEHIEDLTGAVAVLRALRPRRWRWRDREFTGHPVGFVVDELQEDLPAWVPMGPAGPLGVEEMGAVAYLVAAIQEIAVRLEAVEAVCATS